MGSISFNSADMASIRKMGYDSLEHRDDLVTIYNMDRIVETKLHMSPEIEEVHPFRLAQMLDENPRFAKTFIEVAVEYERLAAKGNLLAKGRLAGIYRCSNDHSLQDKARKFAKEAAEAGLPQAQLLYGIFTSNASWLKKAVANDYPYAMFQLGYCYYNGSFGLPKDIQRAHDLWRKANLSHAAFFLLYTQQDYVTDETISKLKNFVHEDRDHLVSHLMANLYRVRGDYQNAYLWYKDAIDRGADSFDDILSLYSKGLMCSEPYSYWVKKREERDLAVAEYYSGDLYAKETEPEPSHTYSYYNSTSSNSSDSSAKTTDFSWILILIAVALAAIIVFKLLF